MSKQIEALKRWVEVFDGNWHDEPVDTEWADRAHQALAEMRQAIAEAEQPAQQDLPDLIAGTLGVSRGTAYDMMREALAEQRGEPLTDEQLEKMWRDGPYDHGTFYDFKLAARDTEAAHGITKGNT